MKRYIKNKKHRIAILVSLFVISVVFLATGFPAIGTAISTGAVIAA